MILASDSLQRNKRCVCVHIALRLELIIEKKLLDSSPTGKLLRDSAEYLRSCRWLLVTG